MCTASLAPLVRGELAAEGCLRDNSLCDKAFMLQRAAPPAFQTTSSLRRGGKKTGLIDKLKRPS